MINTIYELLSLLKDKGIAEIEPYLSIQHNPTIGDMYEGLTKILTDKAIFKGLDLRVTSGKIKNIYGVLSRQIDCMIVVGDGEKIPFTKKNGGFVCYFKTAIRLFVFSLGITLPPP